MRDNVETMTKVFEGAYKLEQYVLIWTEALNHTNKVLKELQDTEEDITCCIQEEALIKYDAETNYDSYRKVNKKVGNKYIFRTLFCCCLVVLFIISSLTLRSNELDLLPADLDIFALPLSIFLIVVSIILVPIILYNMLFIKDYAKDFSKAQKQQQILVSTNNIKAYNIYLDKLQKERTKLLSTKEFIEGELQEASIARNNLYNQDLIPEKYRKMVPIATMYGYLQNGICTIIRGHGGVYERYENDLKLGIIIQHLGEINKKLNIVIKNQEKLYSAMQSINSTLSDIRSEIQIGNNRLNDIRHDTAAANLAAQQSVALQYYQIWRND